MKKVIMFSASWCGPCQRTKPTFLNVKQQTTNVEMEVLDVDESAHMAERYNIRAVPTFVLLNGETEVARTSGGMTEEKLKAFINQ